MKTSINQSAFKCSKRGKINTIHRESIPHITRTEKVRSSNTAVAVSFIQFVRMASGLGCIIKFKEILHTHIRVTKYEAITVTHVEVEVQPSQFQAAQLQLTQSITQAHKYPLLSLKLFTYKYAQTYVYNTYT